MTEEEAKRITYLYRSVYPQIPMLWQAMEQLGRQMADPRCLRPFGPVTFALTGSLPAGLSVATATGQFTGTPAASMAATVFTVSTTDRATPVAQTSSKTFILTVTKATATVALTSSRPVGLIGQPVSLTATMAPVAAAGTVTFFDGAMSLCTAVPLVSGIAACHAGYAKGGAHSVTAVYSGNATYASATSAA